MQHVQSTLCGNVILVLSFFIDIAVRVRPCSLKSAISGLSNTRPWSGLHQPLIVDRRTRYLQEFVSYFSGLRGMDVGWELIRYTVHCRTVNAISATIATHIYAYWAGRSVERNSKFHVYGSFIFSRLLLCPPGLPRATTSCFTPFPAYRALLACFFSVHKARM